MHRPWLLPASLVLSLLPWLSLSSPIPSLSLSTSVKRTLSARPIPMPEVSPESHTIATPGSPPNSSFLPSNATFNTSDFSTQLPTNGSTSVSSNFLPVPVPLIRPLTKWRHLLPPRQPLRFLPDSSGLIKRSVSHVFPKQIAFTRPPELSYGVPYTLIVRVPPPPSPLAQGTIPVRLLTIVSITARYAADIRDRAKWRLLQTAPADEGGQVARLVLDPEWGGRGADVFAVGVEPVPREQWSADDVARAEAAGEDGIQVRLQMEMVQDVPYSPLGSMNSGTKPAAIRRIA